MTRAEQFDEIKQRLENLKEGINNFDRTVIDESQIQEFARAEKVAEYLSIQINTIDADLLPNRFYDDVDNIPIWDKQNIIALNDILDKSLIILNQYRNLNITEESTFQSINDTLKTYDESIKKSIKALNLNNTKNSIKAIEDYKNTLLNSEDSIQKQIADSHAQIQALFNEIQGFNNDFSAKKAEIEKARNEIIDISQQAQGKFSEFKETKHNIDDLEQEIENKQNELDKYDKEQKEKIEALKQGIENLLASAAREIEDKNKEINKLLATATDASLASSYAEAKNSYDKPIKRWTWAFILSIFGILGVAIWTFVDVTDRLEPLVVLWAILLRLPFYAPLAWLAIFATRRRNEIKRLQEEYRHKEAAAKSYFGYREQIQDIEKDKDKKELMEKLMENLVEMTNENPNKALDKTSKENNPTIDFFEKFAKSPEEARNLFKEFMNMFIKESANK